MQSNVNRSLLPPASLYVKVLLGLMLISITLPIFAGYLSGLLLFCWIVNEQISGRLSVPAYFRGLLPEETFDREHARAVVPPALVSMLLMFAAMLLAAFISLFTSPYSASLGKTVHVMLHQMVKVTLLGSVSCIVLFESVRRGAGTLYLAKVLAVWLFIHLVYCLVQRYTGIDLSHGLSARLGEHRYSYGVFRVSGFMGHPLTLTYNLMILTVGSAALAILQWNRDKRSLEFKLWLSVCLLGLATVMISGSRFVLLVLIIVPFICEFKRVLKFWPYVLLAIIVLTGGLWLEGSMVARFSEFFGENQTIYERFPRLLFWKIHWQMFLDYPVAGVSLSGISEATKAYYHASGIHDKMYTAHNVFLQFLADSGLIGFAGLIVFLAGYLKSAIKSVAIKGHNTGLSYLFVATVLVALQQNNLRDSEFLLAFWFFTALLFTFLLQTGSVNDSDKRKPTKDLQSAASGANSASNLPG